MINNDPFNKYTAFKSSFQTPYQEWDGKEVMTDCWLVPYNGDYWFMNNPEDMHEGYDLVTGDFIRTLGEYSAHRIDEEFRLGVVERVGIKLDTPELAGFWERVQDYQDELKTLCDELIHEAINSLFERLLEDAGTRE